MKNLIHIANFILIVCFAMSPFASYADEPADPGPAISAATAKVNINTATADMLAEALKGIGLKKAQAIIEYRQTYGPFHNIEELADVAGIGPSTLAKNAHLIAVK